MVLEINEKHKKARTNAKWNFRERVVVPIVAGTIAISMFSGCSNEKFDNYEDDATRDYSTEQNLDREVKDYDYSITREDGTTIYVKDGKFYDEAAEKRYDVVDADGLTISHFVAQELAKAKGVQFDENMTFTKADFANFKELRVDPRDDLSWIKYCNNLEKLTLNANMWYLDDSLDHTSKAVLAEAPSLKKLEIIGGSFTEEQYGELKNLNSLETLTLGCNPVDSGVVEELSQLNNLEIYLPMAGKFTDFSKLTFLDSILFVDAYRAACCMTVSDCKTLSDAGVKLVYELELNENGRDIENKHLSNEVDDRVFNTVSGNLDYLATLFEFDDTVGNEEKARTIVSSALELTESLEGDDKDLAYYNMVVGVSNRLGVNIVNEYASRRLMADEQSRTGAFNDLDGIFSENLETQTEPTGSFTR